MIKKGMNGIWNLASPCPKNSSNNVPKTIMLNGSEMFIHLFFLASEIMTLTEKSKME